MISLKPQFKADSRSKRMIPALGTFVRLELNLQGEEFLFLSNEVFNEIRRVEKKFSFFDPMSEISKLNETEAGVGVPLSEEVIGLLKLSQDLKIYSQSAFSVGPDLVFDGDQVQKTEAGRVDLGGIAKGHALDCAIEKLFSSRKLAGLAKVSGSLNAGGDLFLFETEETSVRIEGMTGEGPVYKTYAFSHGALATSSAIPKEGASAKYGVQTAFRQSVSVFAKKAVIADALTKVALFSKNREIFADYGAQVVHEI